MKKIIFDIITDNIPYYIFTPIRFVYPTELMRQQRWVNRFKNAVLEWMLRIHIIHRIRYCLAQCSLNANTGTSRVVRLSRRRWLNSTTIFSWANRCHHSSDIATGGYVHSGWRVFPSGDDAEALVTTATGWAVPLLPPWRSLWEERDENVICTPNWCRRNE